MPLDTAPSSPSEAASSDPTGDAATDRDRAARGSPSFGRATPSDRDPPAADSLRVLFELTHPAHVHLFRHAVRELVDEGATVGVTSREKDVTTDLLDAYGLPHTVLSRRGEGRGSLLREWGVRAQRLLRAARRFDPDVIVSRLNPASPHVATLVGARSVVFHDTELAGALARVSLPFADVVCTPERFERRYGDRQVSYPGYHELAYLHPARFEPDPDRLRRAGVDPEEPYAVVRLVSNTAHHDVGTEGLSTDVGEAVVERLAERGAVHVTSERPLDPALERYRTTVPAEAIHDLLAYADLFVGDSATMATEAGVLGTPSLRYSPHEGTMSNFDELEHEYGLVTTVRDADRLPGAVSDLLDRPALAATWERRRDRLLADKVDVTDVIVSVTRGVTA